MRRARGSAVFGAAATTLLAMLYVSPVHAQQPPGPDCGPASKIEYERRQARIPVAA